MRFSRRFAPQNDGEAGWDSHVVWPKNGWPPRNGSYKKNIFLYHLKPWSSI